MAAGDPRPPSEIWCQLFSEPDAGSDLASLQTRAVPVDDGWLLDGPEGVDVATRSSPGGGSASPAPTPTRRSTGASRTSSSTWQAPGIEIRPLVQITGEAEFNEVFFDDVFVPDDHLVGGLDNGWAVANTTLAHERGTNVPVQGAGRARGVPRRAVRSSRRERGALDDVEVADGLAQSFVELRVLRLHNWRTLSRLGRGHRARARSRAGSKLAWTDMTQHLSDAALDVRRRRGAAVVGRDDNPGAGFWQRQWLWSQGGVDRRRHVARSSARSSATASSASRADRSAVAWRA